MNSRSKTTALCASALFGCLGACTAEVANGPDYDQRYANFTREEIRAEFGRLDPILSENPEDPEGREAADALARRVDVLDGLIYELQGEDGLRVKYYEKHPGQVTTLLFTENVEDTERYDLANMSPVESFRAFRPGEVVPQVLLEAEARLAEVEVRSTPPMELPDEQVNRLERTSHVGQQAQHHDVANHVDQRDLVHWVVEHCPDSNSNNCFGDWHDGDLTWTAGAYRHAVWRVLAAHGSITVSLKTKPTGDQLFGEQWGPYQLWTGVYIMQATSGQTYWYYPWWCQLGIISCAGEWTRYKVNHEMSISNAGGDVIRMSMQPSNAVNVSDAYDNGYQLPQ